MVDAASAPPVLRRDVDSPQSAEGAATSPNPTRTVVSRAPATAVRTYRLSGTVLWETTREPVRHAAVTLFQGVHIPVPAATTVTGDDGRFTFEIVPRGASISVEIASDLRLAYHHAVRISAGEDADPDPIVILVPAGRVLRFRVIDTQTKAPVPNPVIRVDSRIVARGDGNGFGELVGVEDRFQGTIAAEHYCSAQFGFWELRDSSNVLEIPMLKSCTIVGRATDPIGTPLGDAWVFGGRVTKPPMEQWGLQDDSKSYELLEGPGVATEPDGSFELTGLRPDVAPYRLCIRPQKNEENTGRLVDEIRLDVPGTLVRHDIVIDLDARVGTVMGSVFLDDKPMVGMVTVFSEKETRSVQVAEDGSFSIDNIGVGTCMVTAQVDGVSAGKSVLIVADKVIWCNLELQTVAPTISVGRVVDEHGDPVEGAMVKVVGQSVSRSVRTATDGVFRVRTFGPRDTDLEFTYEDVWQRVGIAHVPVGTVSTVLEIRRTYPQQVELEADGEPLAPKVSLQWRDPRAPTAEWKFVGEYTHANGGFCVLMPAGPLALRFCEVVKEGPGRRSSVATGVSPEHDGGALRVRLN